jgi:predicted nucleic acid-binding protein
MIPAPFKVVLDANVLFPFTLRDTLLRAAEKGFFQLYWSEEILDETTRNLVSKLNMPEEKAGYLVSCMTSVFPEAMVTGYEYLIPAMRNQNKDRHVAAVAVKVAAQVIVTFNLKDFRNLPQGIEAQSPDEFLTNLFDLDPDTLTQIVEEQAKALKNPPRSLGDLIRGLAKSVPDFAKCIQEYLALAAAETNSLTAKLTGKHEQA